MDERKMRKRWYRKEVMRRRLERRQIRKAVMYRCFFGSGIGNPRYRELVAKMHVIIEHGTCDLKEGR